MVLLSAFACEGKGHAPINAAQAQAADVPSMRAAVAEGEPELPASLNAARSASVIVRFGDRGGCSATKVGERMLLTAAHCKTGYSGHDDAGPARFERDGESHPLEVVEMGAFVPGDGKVQDWLLLAPRDGDDPFAGIRTATLASAAEIAGMVAKLGDSLDDRSTAVWSITYPAPSFRARPRTPMQGGQFASHGYLKSADALRRSVAVAVAQHFVYDDRVAELPAIPPHVEELWASDAAAAMREHYERYAAAGMPILHHSADYAPGSSGGGIFAETTGKLLGIVPFGASIVSRRDAYPGFGQLYRIDAICRESQKLPCPR
jgi:hypothetical protein